MTDLIAAAERSRALSRAVMWAHLLALLAAVIWAMNFSLIKLALRELDAVPLFLLRYDIAAVVLLAIWWFHPPNWRAFDRRGWAIVVALAVLIGPIYQVLLLKGAAGTGAGLIGILIGTQTLHVAWLAPLLLKESLRWQSVVAVLIAFAGVSLPIVATGDLRFETVIYPLLIALAALIGTSNVILSRYMRSKVSAWDLLVLVHVTAAVLCLPMITPTVVDQWRSMSLATALIGLHLGTLGLPFATFCFYLALKHLTALTAAFYLFIMMAISAAWAWLLLGEAFSLLNGIALACVGVGLMINARR